ncbi:AAA family ATPase [Microbacterium sp. 1P10UB]|uniref:MinD/ParA family ATP-binding protein n=1 Tax=unclassified Microbacterium TaxID=2609290 RepID=UPI0039A3000A
MSIVLHPRIYATVTGSTATLTAPDGHTEPLTPTTGEDIRQAIVRRATDLAQRAGTPIELHTSGDRGDHRLLIDPTGHLTPLTTNEAAPLTRRRPTPTSEPEPKSEQPSESDSTEPAATASDSAVTERATFLTGDTVHDTAPSTSRWRFFLPSRKAAERAEKRAAREQAVSRQWAGCRTIAVANGKGGVGKTMTTAMLAAVYARYGGGTVLAWDNNDTRGTLGWRTETGTYDTTVRDLLPQTTSLLGPDATVSDIARYVHHQTGDRYDVLRSNPELLAATQRISTDQFDQLMRVAAHYYRLVIFDSGNDESADRWLRMVDSAWQLVIPTLPTTDSAETAALLLDALRNRDEHSAALAANAVVILTQAEPTPTATLRRIADGFEGHVRAVEIIPFDPALKSGPLRFDHLGPRTRDAWVTAAAQAADSL